MCITHYCAFRWGLKSNNLIPNEFFRTHLLFKLCSPKGKMVMTKIWDGWENNILMFLRSLTKVEFPWKMLFSLTKPLRSHTKRPRSLQTFCAPLRNFTYTVHCIPPRNFVFTCKTFVFAQETFAFTYKTFAFARKTFNVLHSSEKLCIWSQNFCVHSKKLCINFAKLLWETLHLLTKVLRYLRKFLFARTTFAFAQKNKNKTKNIRLQRKFLGWTQMFQ